MYIILLHKDTHLYIQNPWKKYNLVLFSLNLHVIHDIRKATTNDVVKSRFVVCHLNCGYCDCISLNEIIYKFTRVCDTLDDIHGTLQIYCECIGMFTIIWINEAYVRHSSLSSMIQQFGSADCNRRPFVNFQNICYRNFCMEKCKKIMLILRKKDTINIVLFAEMFPCMAIHRSLLLQDNIYRWN